MILNSTDLLNISAALTNAVVDGRFMSTEHAKNVWLNILRNSGYDSEKKKTEVRVETVGEKE